MNLLSDDLSTFIHNWESVIAGMSHIPDEVTLMDTLLRQIHKIIRMKYGLEIFDRAKEGMKERTYMFLVQSVKDLPTRERMRKNRGRVAKSKNTAPRLHQSPVLHTPVAGRPRQV